MKLIRQISRPGVLFSRSWVLSKPSPVPKTSGIYAWFFKETPGITPTDGCMTRNGLTLLYAGISPSNSKSSANLRKRLNNHYRGNASASTLRLTLGVLLQEQSGFPLRRIGSGKRMTFTRLGEEWLNDWMEQNAFVHWIEHSEPWKVEKDVLANLSLPLNIQDNRHHPFATELSSIRSQARMSARQTPIAREGR